MAKDRLLLVVLGMMGRCPFGGQTWLYLNWLRGLARLGHDVYYVEDDATWPYDPRVDSITDDPSYAAVPSREVAGGIGLEGRWAYRPLFRAGTPASASTAPRLRELYRDCDALLNVCGATVLNDDHRAARVASTSRPTPSRTSSSWRTARRRPATCSTRTTPS